MSALQERVSSLEPADTSPRTWARAILDIRFLFVSWITSLRSSRASSVSEGPRLTHLERSLPITMLFNISMAAVTVGCTVAAFTLFSNHSSQLDLLSGHPAFVVVSYVGAFAPFQALDATDYIGPTWKTVRETRTIGRVQYVISTFGIATVILYTHVQQSAADFKEMSAGAVVLIFSIFSLFRSVRGQQELSEFKRWSVAAIATLRRQGIVYDLGHRDPAAAEAGDTKQASDSRIADKIKVNEMVVDNQIWSGRVLFSFSHYIQLCMRVVFRLPWEAMSTNRRIQVLAPKQPVELWINWAIVFAAQGLKCCLLHVDARLPHHLNANIQSCLCIRPDVVEADQARSLEEWRENHRRVMERGTGMPYDAPHLLNDEYHDQPLRNTGYASYKATLERSVEGLPIEFGTEVHNMNTKFLERLAVLLGDGGDYVEEKGGAGVDRISSEFSTEAEIFNSKFLAQVEVLLDDGEDEIGEQGGSSGEKDASGEIGVDVQIFTRRFLKRLTLLLRNRDTSVEEVGGCAEEAV